MGALPSEPVPFADRWAALALLDHSPDFEAWRPELIDGEITMTPPPVPEHERIVTSFTRQLAVEDYLRKLDLTYWSGGTGLRIGTGTGVKPDVIVTGPEAFPEPVEFSDPSGQPIHLVVEVTSGSTRDRDYDVKKRAYAAVGIPNYLIIDRQEGVCRLFQLAPGASSYGPPAAHAAFGEKLPLPEPLGFDLDTSSFG